MEIIKSLGKYNVKYSKDLVLRLTRALDDYAKVGDIKNSFLEAIGKKVSRYVKNYMDISEGGRTWFGLLDFPLDKIRVAILFPEYRNKREAPVVLSTKESEKVKNLIDRLTYQIEDRTRVLVHSSY